MAISDCPRGHDVTGQEGLWCVRPDGACMTVATGCISVFLDGGRWHRMAGTWRSDQGNTVALPPGRHSGQASPWARPAGTWVMIRPERVDMVTAWQERS